MTKLQFFCVSYTRGDAPRLSGAEVRGLALTVLEIPTVVMPTRDDGLFGIHATEFVKFRPARAFLVSVKATQGMASEVFFENARSKLLELFTGVTGYVLDVLRMLPMPVSAVDQLIPYDVMGEDLFSLSIIDRGAQGQRAQTFGLAKLGQSELTFDFVGWHLKDDAHQLVTRIAEWVFQHRKLIPPSSEVPFGYDTLRFTGGTGPARSHHPSLIQKLLPEREFEGTGLCTIEALAATPQDLSAVLEHLRAQQEVLSRSNVVGDSPHHSKTVQVKGRVNALRNLEGMRIEPINSKDSGWSFRQTDGSIGSSAFVPLSELIQQLPELIGFLALPAGSVVWWNSEGRAVTTVSDAAGFDEIPTGEFTLGVEK